MKKGYFYLQPLNNALPKGYKLSSILALQAEIQQPGKPQRVELVVHFRLSPHFFRRSPICSI